MVGYALMIDGDYVLACKNYNVDVQTNMLTQGMCSKDFGKHLFLFSAIL